MARNKKPESQPECADSIWLHRQSKRERGVESIKRTPEYKASGSSGFRTPDATDRAISKRNWEAQMQQWRTALRKCSRDAAAQSPLEWLGGSEYDVMMARHLRRAVMNSLLGLWQDHMDTFYMLIPASEDRISVYTVRRNGRTLFASGIICVTTCVDDGVRVLWGSKYELAMCLDGAVEWWSHCCAVVFHWTKLY